VQAEQIILIYPDICQLKPGQLRKGGGKEY